MRPRQPLYPTRLLNLVGRFSGRLHLSCDGLMEAAVDATGLSDWGRDPFREGLEVFCRAVNQDPAMHHFGRLLVDKGVFKWLTDRLEIQATLRSEPGILDRPVRRPILIPGWVRSGTTLLHRLLAIDPSFRTTRSWEVHFPVPPPSPDDDDRDPRIRKTEKLYQLMNRTSPDLAAAHPMEATLPEECWYFLDRSFVRVLAALYFRVPAYREWINALPNGRVESAYRFHRKQVQILQWRYPEGRWLLKSPVHGVFIQAFDAVYPDATYIVCHREPREVVPSTCSLLAAHGSAHYDEMDLRELAGVVKTFLLRATSRFMEARETMEESRFLDVSFRSLQRDPLGAAQRVYDFLGLELVPDVRSRMIRFLAQQPRGRHRQHRYRAEDFGLDPDALDRDFRAYRDRFIEAR